MNACLFVCMFMFVKVPEEARGGYQILLELELQIFMRHLTWFWELRSTARAPHILSL